MIETEGAIAPEGGGSPPGAVRLEPLGVYATHDQELHEPPAQRLGGDGVVRGRQRQEQTLLAGTLGSYLEYY